MKTSENPLNPTTQDDASAHSSEAQAAALSTPVKKPHLKLFNCLMKPSLSLTSLPPQSPKEASDEAQSVERPYNSLKVSRLVNAKLPFFSIFLKLFLKHVLIVFRKSAMARKSYGDARGNRKLPSAQQHRTLEQVEEEMAPTFGPLTTSSWTQI